MMSTRVKAFLTAAIVAGGLVSTLALNTGSAFAAPPFGWRPPVNYGYNGYHTRYYNNNYNNNNGILSRFWGGNNNYRPRPRWYAANANWGRPNYYRPRRPFW